MITRCSWGKAMKKVLQLHSIRFFATKMEFPECEKWEEIIKQANCKKEPKKLDPVEELGLCEPGPEDKIQETVETVDLTPLTGVPHDFYERSKALIHRNPKNPMQQGTANTHDYLISYYTNDPQWENPLMGWTSGSNSLKDVEIRFPTKKSALFFAKKNGWSSIESKEESSKKHVKKDYGKNFAWNKRTRVSTK